MKDKKFKVIDLTAGAEIVSDNFFEIEEWLEESFDASINWVQKEIEKIMYVLRGCQDSLVADGAGDALNVTWEMV